MKKRKRTNQLTGGFWSTVPRKLVVLAEPPDPAGDGSCGDVLPALPGALVFVLELPVLAPAGSGETPSPLPFALPPVVIADVEVVDDTEDANAEVEPDARADVEADVDVDTDADVDEEDDVVAKGGETVEERHLDGEGEEVVDEGVEELVGHGAAGHVSDGLEAVVDVQTWDLEEWVSVNASV